MRYRPVMVLVTAALLLVSACGGDPEQGQAQNAPSATETAAATEPTTTTDAADATTSAPAANQPPLMLIMDLSGSMTRPDPDGGTLLDGAAQALHDVVRELPDGAPTGLMVYGHRYPNSDKVNGCNDVEIIQPVQPLDREALLASIEGLSAKGFTPIGKSLQDAAAALPPEGERTIVLVSDGEDTCAPPHPCDVARELRADGVDLVVNTIGFALGDNERARTELNCIADAAGGTFVDAADAAELSDALARAAVRDRREAELSGTILEGAPLPRDAKTGALGTRYTDTVLSGETNFYRFEVAEESTVEAEVIMIARAEGCGRLVRVSTVDSGDSTYKSKARSVKGRDDGPAIFQVSDTVDDDEVYLKVDTEGCTNQKAELDIEFEVTTA